MEGRKDLLATAVQEESSKSPQLQLEPAVRQYFHGRLSALDVVVSDSNRVTISLAFVELAGESGGTTWKEGKKKEQPPPTVKISASYSNVVSYGNLLVGFGGALEEVSFSQGGSWIRGSLVLFYSEEEPRSVAAYFVGPWSAKDTAGASLLVPHHVPLTPLSFATEKLSMAVPTAGESLGSPRGGKRRTLFSPRG